MIPLDFPVALAPFGVIFVLWVLGEWATGSCLEPPGFDTAGTPFDREARRMDPLLRLSPHAQTRMQQRGISAAALDALLEFGRMDHLSRDKDIVFFDKKARARLAKGDSKVARKAERFFRTYAILGGNGLVITVGHRYRRIQRI